MRLQLLSFGFAAWAGVSSLAVPALAQVTTAEKASAELLFDAGLRLMNAGSFAEACPKLVSSQRIEPAVGTLLYLGECYEKSGRTTSAWVTFREAAALARAAAQPQRATVAQARADRLQRDLALLTIEFSPEARALPGLSVRSGPVNVDVGSEGVPVPVDPGEVIVEARAPGYSTFSKKVMIRAGGRETVQIPALLPAHEDESRVPLEPPLPLLADRSATSGGANGAPAGPGAASPAEPHARPVPPLAIVLGGVGVVGLGVGTFFGVRAISDSSKARELCPDGACREASGETKMDDARSAARVSNLAFAVGGASLAGGLVLYLLRPERPAQAGVGFVPFVSGERAGITWTARL